MLKVIGASWWKTRISSYILGFTVVLAALLLLLAELERPEPNGVYCATAFWSPKFGFRVEFWGQQNDLTVVPEGVARACYKDSTLETGWSWLEVDTQAEYPDRIQAFAAGMLEGALTWAKIYDHWSNTIESDCESDDESRKFCSWARDLLEENYDNIKQEAEIKGHNSQYWYQVWLFYNQLAGLEHGWNMGVIHSRQDLEIPETDFHMLNAASDLRDLKDYYGKFIDPQYLDGNKPKTGMMFLKLLTQDRNASFMFGHSSDGSYSSMLRMNKRYNLRYHFSAKHNSPLVPGVNISFTGFPGTIYSSDDFYLVAGKEVDFIVGGIRLRNENKTVWEEVVLEDTTILGPRVMAANRLAHNGRSWCKYMSHRGATGNKQWMMIDKKQMSHQAQVNEVNSETKDYDKDQVTLDNDYDSDLNETLDWNDLAKEGFIWIADQVPGKLHFQDMTNEITKTKYWFANGAPFLKETVIMSDINQTSNQSVLVDETQNQITTIKDLALLLQNLSYRGDLDNDNPQPFGNRDMKLYAASISGTVALQTLNGPLLKTIQRELVSPPQARRSTKSGSKLQITETVPFSWAHTPIDAPHRGQPMSFNFDPISPQWVWIPTVSFTPVGSCR